MSSVEGQSDWASAPGVRRSLRELPRLLPIAGAILLALSPFVAWTRLELHGVWERGDGSRGYGSELAGDLNLFETASWSGHSRIWAGIPLLLAAFAVHAVVRPKLPARRLILGGLLSAVICGLLYATLVYSIKEYFTNYPQIRFGLFVALAGSVALIADGTRRWLRHRQAAERTPSRPSR